MKKGSKETEGEVRRGRGGGDHSYGGSRNLKGSAGYCLWTVSISLAHLWEEEAKEEGEEEEANKDRRGKEN